MHGHKKQRCSVRKTMHMPDGSFYSGSWYDDKPSGYGKMEYKSGITYSGWFLAGKRHGHGVESNKAGIVLYDGNWDNDLRHGTGILVIQNVGVYKGEFANGKYHGSGTLYKSDNDWYTGQWYRGLRHGKGTYQNQDGKYVGEYCYNLRNGVGQMTYNDKSVYTGTWRQNLRCGQGILTCKEGVYDGSWKHGKKSGQGRWVSKKEGTYEGKWKLGLRHFKGTQKYINGDIYTGGWNKGKRTGHGVMTYANGTEYNGFWSRDERQGRGQWTTDESVFVGCWENDEREGMFTETFFDGRISRGPWLHDLRHGTFEYTRDKKTTRVLYIWGVRNQCRTKKSARRYAIRLLKKSDILAVEELMHFYPRLLKWKLLKEHDTQGRLVHMMNRPEIIQKCKKHAWSLFKDKRYAFIEQCVLRCTESELEHLNSSIPILFDAVTHDFVANPWIVGNVSYSPGTRKKLLEGLHLGEIGRCPPKDPFTRLELTESSGTYLSENKEKAKTVYKTFCKIIGHTSNITQLAFQFDLEDYEKMITNARDARDKDTLRALMIERNEFIQRRGSFDSL